MNVLSITFGTEIAEPGEDVFSGSKQRQADYASVLDEYHIVVETPEKEQYRPYRMTDNLYIYPTKSQGKVDFLQKAYRKARSVIRSTRIDCISTADPWRTALVGIMLSRQYQIPLQIHVMSDMINNKWYREAAPGNVWRERFARCTLPWAHGIRVSTRSETRKLSRLYGGNRVFRVPFYIDQDSFEPEGNAKEVERFAEQKNLSHLVLFVGRLAKQKDLPTLLKAMTYLDDEIGLVIVGDGPERSLIESLIKQYDLTDRVLLAGEVPYTEVPNYFSSCDVFAITSVHEGTCMVLQEAAMSGLPVVATRFAGAKDVIQSGDNGYLVDLRDSRGVADSCEGLLKNPEKRNKMGQKNKSRIEEEFNKEEILEAYKTMWQETIQNHGISSKAMN